MSPHLGTMVLAGSANLLLAGAWMMGALLGTNGMDSLRGSAFLAAMALALVLLWVGGLVLARRLTAWGLARSWNAGVCVVLAALLTVAAWVTLALVTTLVLAMVGLAP